MARPLRLELAGGFYHVYSRGIERKAIFRGDGDREDFLKRLAEFPERFGVEVHAYVLMENHYHLLLRPKNLNLSQAMQWIQVGYSIYFNLKHRRVGPLFQGRYKSVLIGDEGQLSEITRYLHLNPIRTREFGLDYLSRKKMEKGVVAALDAETIQAALQRLLIFPWSSYRSYAGLAKTPAWLKTELAEGMGSKAYRRYVEEGIRMDMPADPWEGGVLEGFLGTREKLEQLKRKLKVKGNRQQQKGLRQAEGLLPWDTVVGAVEKLMGQPWIQLCGEHGNPGRDLALLAGRRYCGLSLNELGQKAGGVKYPAVSQAVRLMEKKLANEKPLLKQWQALKQFLNI